MMMARCVKTFDRLYFSFCLKKSLCCGHAKELSMLVDVVTV
jgi:hypothetical protein